MKRPSKAEQAEALNSLIPGFDDTPLPILDRSDLERAAECPFQAHAVRNKLVNITAACMDSGNCVHGAYSSGLREWLASNGDIELHDLLSVIEFELVNARPDLQPDVIQGGRASMWAWAKFIMDVHPDNILAYDGGEPEGRSGQLAWDMPDLGVRVTSEVDLLLAGDSVKYVREIDYKSGWKHWTATAVKQSFQFQMHAALILRKFPNIEAVETQVWATRANNLTLPVVFERKHINDYESRIRQAVIAWNSSLEHPPTWPSYDKCTMCPAAAICPEASADIRDVAADPQKALLQLVAIDSAHAKLTKLLASHVDKSGEDLVAGDVAFGRQKPKAVRKPSPALYPIKAAAETTAGESPP